VKKIIAASLLLLTLISCADPVQPTTTVMTPTPTRIPTTTPTPSRVPPTVTPSAQPTAEWNGIPIMPGASAGEGDEEGYVFAIQATPAQIQEYYQLELGKLGWQFVSQEQGDSSITLLFTNNASVTVTVSIIAKGEQALVLLAK
jgi:hypothetical protein